MYGPNDELATATDDYYEPDEDDQEQWYLDAGCYDDGYEPDGGDDFFDSEPDPDDARDRMIEDDRWDGVS